MPEFKYTARTQNNNVHKGTITASNRASAVAALQDRELTPVVIKPKSESWLKMDISHYFQRDKVKTQDLVVFTRQLATMVSAGLPLMKALSTLKDQTESPRLAQVTNKVASEVQSGVALSDALEQHPKVFSSVYVNMVRAGEAGGILDTILNRLAEQVEKQAEMKGKVKGAMIYPGVISTFTVVAFVFIMTGIVPKLSGIFEQFGAELPKHTQIMLAISRGLRNYGVLIGIVAAGLVVAFIRFIHTDRGKHMFHRALLKIPILGDVLLKVDLARFARTFSALTNAGVSVLDSLQVTADAINNVIIKDAVLEGKSNVKSGEPLSKTLLAYDFFPPMLGRMTAIGEETGEVDVVLEKVAQFYEEEVDRVINSLTSIIEPILIVVLGGMVGMIMASVFGPLASLTQVIE